MPWFRKRTTFVGGGLKRGRVSAAPRLAIPGNWQVPRYADARPFCLPSSNQGPSPHCAGYAAAGWCEVQAWLRTGTPAQVDGDAIYGKAKRHDGDPGGDGTTLEAAVRGAKDLGYLPESAPVRTLTSKRDLQWALHRHRVALVGFDITDEWNDAGRNGWIGRRPDAELLGGHAVLACYYDSGCVGWQNSWGARWGWEGYGRMTWDQFAAQFMYGVVVEDLS